MAAIQLPRPVESGRAAGGSEVKGARGLNGVTRSHLSGPVEPLELQLRDDYILREGGGGGACGRRGVVSCEQEQDGAARS